MREDFNKIDQPHLRDYLQVIIKRRWIVISIFIIVSSLLVIHSFRKEDIYSATCQIIIEREERSSVVFTEAVGIETSQQDYYQTQYILLKSRSLLGKVAESLDLKKHPEYSQSKDVVYELRKNIQIEPVRFSRLVNIVADSSDPALAAKIANRLADIYAEENLRNRFSRSEKFSALSSGDVALEEDEILSDSTIQTLPSVINHSMIQNLKTEYARLESRHSELSKRYRERHPRMIELRASMETMQRKIDEETQKVVNGIKTELSGALKGNNIRVIDYAEPPRNPSKPNRRRDIAVALIAGLFPGVGLAMFLDYLDNTIKTKEDVQQYLELPFLGYIPVIEKNRKDPFKRHRITLDNKNSHIAESYRNIRTNLLFSATSIEAKAIVVTSAGPGEGKSTTVTNLAVTLANNGEKVVIVDADMRKPVIHNVFKIPKAEGLSTYLAGNSKIDEIILPGGIDNLDIICSGKIPPNPNDLLGHNRFGELISRLRKKYDRIIIDTPPIGNVSDGLIASKNADGVILILQYKRLARNIIANAHERLSEIDARTLGVIINNFNIKAEGYGSSPYYYYYYRDKE